MNNAASNADFAAAWSASRDHMASQAYADEQAAAAVQRDQANYDRAVSLLCSTFCSDMNRYVGTDDAPSLRLVTGSMGTLEAQFKSEVTAKGFTVTEGLSFFTVTSPSV